MKFINHVKKKLRQKVGLHLNKEILNTLFAGLFPNIDREHGKKNHFSPFVREEINNDIHAYNNQ